MEPGFQLKEGERLDELLGGLKVIQKVEGHRFSLEAVLLSKFVEIRGSAKAIDLGTGCGVIPLILAAIYPAVRFWGLEIQEELVDMAKRSVTLNGLEDIITIIQGDIKQVKRIFREGDFDLCLSNPPFIERMKGRLSPLENRAIAKHELCCSLEDIIRGGSYLLPPQGKIALIHRPERLGELLSLMSRYDLKPSRLRFVHPSLQKKANLFLVEGIKGGKEELKVLSPLGLNEVGRIGK